jgi:hypothetical protein
VDINPAQSHLLELKVRVLKGLLMCYHVV